MPLNVNNHFDDWWYLASNKTNYWNHLFPCESFQGESLPPENNLALWMELQVVTTKQDPRIRETHEVKVHFFRSWSSDPENLS